MQYKEQLKYSIDLHGGIYYFKKSKEVDAIYKVCIDISNNYKAFRFKDFRNPADEPIIALAMAVNGAKPIDQINDRFCFLRNAKKLRADFFGRRLEYWFNGSDITGGKLVHFGTSRTILPRYQIEKRKVDYEWMHKKKWNAFIGSAYLIAAYAESFVLCVRSSKKLLFKKSRI